MGNALFPPGAEVLGVLGAYRGSLLWDVLGCSRSGHAMSLSGKKRGEKRGENREGRSGGGEITQNPATQHKSS